MRTFAILLVAGGLGGLFLWQKHHAPEAPANDKPAIKQAAAASPGSSVAAPREPSEHNWMKRSLDRARDVRDQARSHTAENQKP